MVLADEALGLGFKLEAPEENDQGKSIEDRMEREAADMYQGNTLAETPPPDILRDEKSNSGLTPEHEQVRDR